MVRERGPRVRQLRAPSAPPRARSSHRDALSDHAADGPGNSFAVGAVTGLTLERELVSGLALRLSSSILGVSYGQSASHVSTPDTSVDLTSHGLDAGLRFSPSLEVRYAF